MALFKVRAIGFIDEREEETFYIIAAESERLALESFKRTQPETDPDFDIETYDIELYSMDDVAMIDESLCAI